MSKEIKINIKTSADFRSLNTLIAKIKELESSFKGISSASRSVTSMANALTKMSDSLEKSSGNIQKVSASLAALNGTSVKLSNSMAKTSAASTGFNKNLTNTAAITAKVSKALQEQATIFGKADRAKADAAKAANDLTVAEKNLDSIMGRGDTSANERTQALERYNKALADSRTAEKQLAQQEQVMIQQQTKLGQLGMELAGKKNALGSVDINKLTVGDVNQLNAAYQHFESLQPALQSAMRQSQVALTQQDTAIKDNVRTIEGAVSGRAKLAEYYQTMSQGSEGVIKAARALAPIFNSSIASMVTTLARLKATTQSALSTVAGVLKTISTLARTLGSTLSSSLKAAANVFSAFGRTANTVLSSLSAAMNGIGGAVKSFTGTITSGFSSAQKSLTSFYNAGYALVVSGSLMRNQGKTILGSVFGNLDEYTDYERALTRAATAGSQFDQGKALQEQIFSAQRGGGPGSIENPPLMGFTAKELADAMYYYSSAIGKAVTPENFPAVKEMLQVADITQTGIETMTKGVLNIAQEFGIDPTKDANQKVMVDIAAQVGYLANQTSLETSDIIEMFKMVGPMAHILSDRNTPGAGLQETFGLADLASRVGLRGSRVGSGINQLLTTLLDPTDKAIETAATAWGDKFGEGTLDNWKKFFFNDDGELVGGIQGLLAKIADIPEKDQASFLAQLFTTNATRAAVGIQQAIKDGGGLDKIMNDIKAESAVEWVSKALIQQNNTVGASMQYVKNAWFQLQTMIVDSVKGPMIKALQSFGEVLFKIGDVIHANPWIGQLVSGFATIAGAVLSVIGTLLTFGGTILLVLKAFAMLGGFTAPLLFFFTSMASGLIIVTALMVGLAAVAVVLKNAWESNFLGIQDKTQSFFNALRDGMMWMEKYGPTAFQIFGQRFETEVMDRMQKFSEWLHSPSNTLATGINIFGGSDISGQMTPLQKIQDFIAGFKTGFINSFIGSLNALLAAFRAVFDYLAQVIPQIAGYFQGLSQQFTGSTTTAGELGRVIGTVLGAALASLLVFQLLPNIEGLIKFSGALVTAGFEVAGFGLKIIGLTINYAAQTIALGLQAAAWLENAVAKGIDFAASTALAAVTAILEVETLSLAAALTVVLAAMLAVAAIALGLALAITAVVGAVLTYVAVTQGLNAALADGQAFLEGMLSVLIPVGAAFLGLVQVIAGVVEAVLSLVNVSLDFYDVGVAVGALIATALVAGLIAAASVMVGFGLAIVEATVALAAFIVEAALAAAPWIAVGIAIGAAVYIFGEVVGWGNIIDGITSSVRALGEAWGWVSDGASKAADKVNEVLSKTDASLEKQKKDAKDLYMSQNIPEIGMDDVRGNTKNGVYSTQFGSFSQNTNETDQQYLDRISRQQRMYYSVAYEHDGKMPANSAPTAGGINPFFSGGQGGTAVIKQGQDDAAKASSDYSKGYIDKLLANPVVKQITDALGVSDINNMGDLEKMLGFDPANQTEALSGVQKTLDDLKKMTTDNVDDVVKQYTKAKNAWDTYQDNVKKQGLAATNIMYKNNDMEIPVDPGTFQKWEQDNADAFDQSADELQKEIEAKMTEMNQGILDSMTSMDFSGAVKGIFSSGLGGGMSAAEGINKYADTIIKNAGSPEWLNPMELLADVAGTGKGAMNISGQNVHKALEPALQIIAEQTGVAVNDLMKDIPKYIVPDQFVPMAQGMLLDQLSKIPTGMYKELDTLGVADGYTKFGLDWSELTDYAIGQGMEHHKWNLASYISDSWDISMDQANDYIASHGLDPNIINDKQFKDLQLVIDSQGGTISVLTDDWMKYLQDVTNNFTDKTIEISKGAFDALPDIVKMGYSNMGYTFVVGATETSAQIIASYDMLRKAIESGTSVYDDAGAVLSNKKSDAFWNDFWDQERAGQVTDKITEFVDDYGNSMTKVEDAAGNYIIMPTVDFQAMQDSIDGANEQLDKLERVRDRIKRLKDEINNLKDDLSSAQDSSQAVKDAGYTSTWGDMAAGNIETSVDELLGKLERARKTRDELLGLNDQGQLVVDLDIKVPDMAKAQISTDVQTMVSDGVQAAFADSATFTIDTSAFSTQFQTAGTQAGQAFMTAFSSSMSGKGRYTDAGAGRGDAASPFDSVFQGYGSSAAHAFETQFNTSFGNIEWGTSLAGGGSGAMGGSNPFDGIFSGYGASAANAFKSAFQSNMAGFNPTASAPTPNAPEGPQLPQTSAPAMPTTQTIKITADTSGYFDQINGVVVSLDHLSTTEYKVTLTVDNTQLAEVFNQSVSALDEFNGKTYTTTISGDRTPFAESYNPVIVALDAFQTSTYTTTISGDASSFWNVFGSVINSLNTFGSSSYTTSLDAVDNVSGVISNITSALNNMPTSKTVTINTVNTSTTVGGGSPTSAATGLASGGPVTASVTNVGEDGTELLFGGEGGYVANAYQTKNFMKSLGTVSRYLPEFMNSSNMAQSASLNRYPVASPQQSAQQGDININIKQINMTRDVDLNEALNKLDILQGRRIEMAKRGMIPINDSRTA
jgi:TP901 family phage tail tape measure protein